MKIEFNESVKMNNVKITGSFWKQKQEDVRTRVIPYQWDALNDNIKDAEPSYAMQNFKIAAGLQKGEFNGRVFQDSDLAKFLEAVAYSLISYPDEKLEKIADYTIDLIGKTQESDGYLDTSFILKNKDKRWTNLERDHELYVAGHMIEAAVAYYYATGKKKFLSIMEKLVNCIDTVLGSEEGKKHGYPGHEEIELALVRMYEVTKDEKLKKLASYFINQRGQMPHYWDVESQLREGDKANTTSQWKERAYQYNQSHKPVREQREAIGHSVRAVYLYSGMAGVSFLNNDETLANACDALFDNVVKKQMYITGGIGSESYGEEFTFDYDLPNDTCYTETCASIGLVFWAKRMLNLKTDRKYSDAMELALYNSILSGMSLDGTKFFYVNPLEVWPESARQRHDKRHVEIRRQNWFGCACCPLNLARLLASVGEYIYTTSSDQINVHLYLSNQSDIKLVTGNVKITQKTDYPFEGNINISLNMGASNTFTLALRIPAWSDSYSLKLNDKMVDCEIADGYAKITQEFKNDDVVVLELDMKPFKIKSNPQLRYNAGKVALQRGPIVYCLEEIDNSDMLTDIELINGSPIEIVQGSGIYESIPLLKTKGFRSNSEWNNELYKKTNLVNNKKIIDVLATPYFMWNNRGVGELLVWIRQQS